MDTQCHARRQVKVLLPREPLVKDLTVEVGRELVVCSKWFKQRAARRGIGQLRLQFAIAVRGGRVLDGLVDVAYLAASINTAPVNVVVALYDEDTFEWAT